MLNTKARNDVGGRIEDITKWHHDRNLIDGATDWAQTEKLFEEFIELVAAQIPNGTAECTYDAVFSMLDHLYEGNRIKPVKPEDTETAMVDAIGDMGVVMINILERNKWTVKQALTQAYDEIKDRKGKMINGMYVKEADYDN